MMPGPFNNCSSDVAVRIATLSPKACVAGKGVCACAGAMKAVSPALRAKAAAARRQRAEVCGMGFP